MKTNKLVKVLFMPVVLFAFVIGWCLYFVGEDKQKVANSRSSVRKSAGKDCVEFSVVPLQERKVVAE
ncbi:MAG: hypothetical protein ACBZ72_05235 [Candidatus Bathyarchaeia archaeon]